MIYTLVCIWYISLYDNIYTGCDFRRLQSYFEVIRVPYNLPIKNVDEHYVDSFCLISYYCGIWFVQVPISCYQVPLSLCSPFSFLLHGGLLICPFKSSPCLPRCMLRMEWMDYGRSRISVPETLYEIRFIYWGKPTPSISYRDIV